MHTHAPIGSSSVFCWCSCCYINKIQTFSVFFMVLKLSLALYSFYVLCLMCKNNDDNCDDDGDACTRYRQLNCGLKWTIVGKRINNKNNKIK